MLDSIVLAAAVLGAAPQATAPATRPAPPPDPVPVTVAATLPAASLEPGPTYAFDVRVTPGAGWSASAAGVPGVVIQLDPPASVRLDGPVLTDPKDLARNGFLHAPFERLVEAETTRIPFTLTAEPAADDRIGIVICAYLRGDDGTMRFVRRRLELPVSAGATAVPGDHTDSTWGGGASDFVAIGDVAPAFRLPRADGTQVELASFRDRSRVVLTTYRAFW